MVQIQLPKFSFGSLFYILRHFSSLLKQMHMDALFDENPKRTSRRFTMVVPTNTAWEKAQLDFSKAYATILEGQFPAYVSGPEVLTKSNADH